jgi:predicted HAD superfamily Cof-like phosphohydrolase
MSRCCKRSSHHHGLRRPWNDLTVRRWKIETNDEAFMTNEQRSVAEFHETFGIAISAVPTVPDESTQSLRVRLIQEEFDELRDALERRDISLVAKELADLLYVVYGTAVSCGIDMDPVFREVHRSNMSKIGGHKRADGKWVKPTTYSPAVIEPIVTAQERRSRASARGSSS